MLTFLIFFDFSLKRLGYIWSLTAIFSFCQSICTLQRAHSNVPFVLYCSRGSISAAFVCKFHLPQLVVRDVILCMLINGKTMHSQPPHSRKQFVCYLKRGMRPGEGSCRRMPWKPWKFLTWSSLEEGNIIRSFFNLRFLCIPSSFMILKLKGQSNEIF